MVIFVTMNKIFLLSLSLAATLCLGTTRAQTEVFNEDFQGGIPSTWTILDLDSLTPHPNVSQYDTAWIATEDPDSLEDIVAGATSYFEPAGQANRWLITPQINLGAYGNILYWNAKTHDASFEDSYLVLISTTGVNPEDFTDTVGIYAFENAYWTERSINLSDSGYVSENVHVAFVLVSEDAYILYLDDVKMDVDDPVGLLAQEKNHRIAFGEESINFIGITPEKVDLYDLTGREITLEKVVDSTFKTDHKGTAILRYEINGEIYSRRLILD